MLSLYFLFIASLASLGHSVALRDYSSKCGIFIGAAANDGALVSDATYAKTLGYQYNLVTAENACKFSPTEPSQNNYNFTQCDAIRAEAQQTNQTFRGHNLVWGMYNPSWLTNGNFSETELEAIMTNHIQTVVKYYGNSVYSWDVVNEAVSDQPKNERIYKDNTWYPKVPNYVELAFRAARAANPTVKLFYNDYGIASSQSYEQRKSDAVYNMLKDMKSNGVPIDGIGLQLHVQWNFDLFDGVRANIQRLGQLGLEVHVTELDVQCYQCDSNMLQQQAVVYGALLDICISEPSCKNFETWGFTDKYSWLGEANHPLPLDENYNPKPAFNTMVGILQKC